MKEGEEHFLESDQAPRKEEGREGDGRTLEVNAIRGGACARVRTPYGTGSDPVSNANLCNPTRCTRQELLRVRLESYFCNPLVLIMLICLI